jgi:electron transfer flavoprotein alpha subunit
MENLIFLEQIDNKFPSSNLSAISLANKFDGKNSGVFIGRAHDQFIDEALNFLSQIYYIKTEKDLTAEFVSEILKSLIKKLKCKRVIATNSTYTKDLFPRVAGQTKSSMGSDIIGFIDSNKFLRTNYTGNIITEVTLNSPLIFITCRQSTFEDAKNLKEKGRLIEQDVANDLDMKSRIISTDILSSDRPALNDAKVVIGIGRGIKSKENFDNYIEKLANLLNGAIGGTRTACDLGYISNDLQIGQTGKIIAPDLYINIGISGATQHIAGIRNSKIIISINNDELAPIFEYSDYIIHNDWQNIIPQIINLLSLQ